MSNVTKCARCDKSIYAADKCEKYEGKIYHSDCFKCSHVDCGTILTSRNVKGLNKMPYCNKHLPNNMPVPVPSDSGPASCDNSNTNVTQPSTHESVQLTPSNTDRDFDDITSQPFPASSSIHTNLTSDDNANNRARLQKEVRSIIRNSSSQMTDEVFRSLSSDMHIVVCGSPRVGKSTLINAICGRKVAEAREGLASVTQAISCHTMEGECDTGSDIIHYKYNFWDTPGFESWEKNDIRKQVKKIVEEPKTKPLCMIFCASPGAFVDLTQLEWLLNLCINEKHIFCALVCTNKYAGQSKSRHAVLESFNRLLSKYVNDPPRKEKDITFYGNIGLCTAVNSDTYEDDDRVLPAAGINEFIYAIMETLVDEEVLKWCLLVLENEGFWNDMHQKADSIADNFTEKKKALKKWFSSITRRKVKVRKSKSATN